MWGGVSSAFNIPEKFECKGHTLSCTEKLKLS